MIGRKERTKMSWTILFQSFNCGLFGNHDQTLVAAKQMSCENDDEFVDCVCTMNFKEMKKKNQLVPAQSPPEEETNGVEVVVRSEVEDKSNQNKSMKMVRVDRDNHEDGDVEHSSEQDEEGKERGEKENCNIVSHD
ncbi:unnamed protein product [Sphenostylis stenocarpa]|uniref:Uncharacterized protein n=1 Tax=Sphenostylis stenocarpa TaxID=92480 RepID=A0AA86SKP0_9FABA|nr:unnamed protein product [Sphenostylis stenocarpa]